MNLYYKDLVMQRRQFFKKSFSTRVGVATRPLLYHPTFSVIRSDVIIIANADPAIPV